jgi:hypothetical protein
MNVAVTVETRFSEKRHIGFVPRQAPAQRENFHPIVGFAARVIVPTGKRPLQRVPHAIPAGELVTLPEPTFFTERAAIRFEKLAVTVVSPVTVSGQVGAVPVHPPDQPEKIEVASGVAVSVAFWPVRMSTVHVVPQFSEPLESVTVPPPVPIFCTVTLRAGSTNVWKKKSASEPSGAVPFSVHARPPA